jgi:DNA-binding transcriptional MocR family regulator
VPFRLLGDTAGIHIVLELPDDYPTARLVAAAAARGVAVYPLMGSNRSSATGVVPGAEDLLLVAAGR